MKSNFFTEFNNLYFFEFVLFYKLAHAQSDAISDSVIIRPCVDYGSFWHTCTIIDRVVCSCKNIHRTLLQWGLCTCKCTSKCVCAQCMRNGDVAQLGERCLRKAEAEGSTPFISTILFLPFLHYSTCRNTNILIRKNSSSALSV